MWKLNYWKFLYIHNTKILFLNVRWFHKEQQYLKRRYKHLSHFHYSFLIIYEEVNSSKNWNTDRLQCWWFVFKKTLNLSSKETDMNVISRRVRGKSKNIKLSFLMSKITPVSNYETLILPFITFSRVFVVKFWALKVAHNECFRIVKALSKSGKIVKISHLRR